MDLKTLESDRIRIQQSITEAQKELADAKAKRIATGEYADQKWFEQQRAIVREKTIELHNINRAIKTARSAENRNSYQSVFIDLVKKRLDPTIFAEIHKDTMNIINQMNVAH